MIGPELFAFLRELKSNNNREWFQKHKPQYVTDVVEPVTSFIAAMAPRVAAISEHILVDPRPHGGSMFRIYRDTRFGKDKSPYKTHVGAQFRHEAGKDAHAPGYYMHLEPGRVFFGGGVWGPKSDALRAIRQRIADKPAEWRAATEGMEVQGERLKTAPRDFDRDHPMIEDLRLKSFFLMADGDEALATSDGFTDAVTAQFEKAAPLMLFIAKAQGHAF